MNKIAYYDGNGNGYIIEKADFITIEYNPIKPELSSSGIYDGGDYVKKEITTSQFDEVLTLFNEAISKKDEHVENRMKGTGIVAIHGEDKCILSMGSKSIEKIEEKLKLLL